MNPDLEQELPRTRRRSVLLVQWFVHICVIFVLAGEPVPAINESHYLTKAKHVWDDDYAPGDLFLQSHDSHLLASAAAGLLAHWMPLTAVAWLGRLLSWSLLALAWSRLSSCLRIPAVLSPLALASWYLAMEYGHWAGEWAVGGFEAKSIAYPCVLFALAAIARERWNRGWVWLGLAVAWHPLVGGWAGLSVGMLWLSQPDLLVRFRQQSGWLLLAFLIGLVGVVPAATGLTGPNRVENVVASQIHVYMRLPHHLCPRLFADERHVAALASVGLLSIVSFIHWRRHRGAARAAGLSAAAKLLIVAWLAVGFSVVGGLIDAVLTPTHPATASSLLRFYWFRWSDVAVPLATCLVVWQWIGQAFMRQTFPSGSATWTTGLASAAVGLSVLVVGLQVHLHWDQHIPAADRLVVDSVGPHRATTDRYTDWLSVCEWIRENTPSDSLWFTPKYQQSFKWHAGRAEVVCWKDIPQDNASVHEWYRRMLRCEPPRDRMGQTREWTTEELLELAGEYGFRWILLDRSIQQSPPLLELMYPTFESGRYVDNRSFAVVRVPESLLEVPH